MRIYVDIDGTICDTYGLNYLEANPRNDVIKRINKWYHEGNVIVYWTGRGIIDKRLTRKQLAYWGCCYHKLIMDKPDYDVFFDDKAFNAKDLMVWPKK